MNISELAEYINMKEIPNSWKIGFQKIVDNVPKKVEWLDIEKAKEILDFYELKEEKYRNKYIETVEMIQHDEILKYIVYLWHYILYVNPDDISNDVWTWKVNKELYSKHGSYMLPVVAMFSGYEIHKQKMKERGFNQKQINYQKENIKKTCLNDMKNYHIEGIRFSQMIWGSYFMKGRIIQVGRLQYELKVTNFDKLKRYVGKDRDYIYIHIPEGKDLLEREVDESLIEAKKCIEKYYPEIDINHIIFYTKTWLLSKELSTILDSNSNIMKFQKRFLIVEQEECKKDFLNFVFKAGLYENIDYHTLPENTYLQKNIKEYLINGKTLHIGLGILK